MDCLWHRTKQKRLQCDQLRVALVAPPSPRGRCATCCRFRLLAVSQQVSSRWQCRAWRKEQSFSSFTRIMGLASDGGRGALSIGEGIPDPRFCGESPPNAPALEICRKWFWGGALDTCIFQKASQKKMVKLHACRGCCFTFSLLSDLCQSFKSVSQGPESTTPFSNKRQRVSMTYLGRRHIFNKL